MILTSSFTMPAAKAQNDALLDPRTFPTQIKDILGVVADYNYKYTGKTEGGQRCFTYNNKTTKYEPLRFKFRNLMVISDGIERKKNPKTGEIMDGYQLALGFPDEKRDPKGQSKDAYNILKAIDDWMPGVIFEKGNQQNWNGGECESASEAAKFRYTKCLYTNMKRMVTKDGTDIPEDKLKSWDPKDKFPKYRPSINLDIKQEQYVDPSDPEKQRRVKSERFKADFVTADNEVLDVTTNNYGGLFGKHTVVKGIIQLDYISSTIGPLGRNRISLSLVQAQEVASEQQDMQADGKRVLYDLSDDEKDGDDDASPTESKKQKTSE